MCILNGTCVNSVSAISVPPDTPETPRCRLDLFTSAALSNQRLPTNNLAPVWQTLREPFYNCICYGGPEQGYKSYTVSDYLNGLRCIQLVCLDTPAAPFPRVSWSPGVLKFSKLLKNYKQTWAASLPQPLQFLWGQCRTWSNELRALDRYSHSLEK